MGWTADVECKSCGYAEGHLKGIGHQVGDSGLICATVTCPVAKRLVDIEADCSWYGTIIDDEPEREMTPDDFRDGPPLPNTGPCPLCGEKHELWDEKTAVCPQCGQLGCTVTETGWWD